MTANNHLAGDAVVGAVGIVNDRDNVGGGREPGGFDKEDALVLAAEAAAVLIVEDANVAMLALPLLAAHLRMWLQGRGQWGGGGEGKTMMGGGSGSYAMNHAGATLDNDSCHPLSPLWCI
jgi:hypothetical protein